MYRYLIVTCADKTLQMSRVIRNILVSFLAGIAGAFCFYTFLAPEPAQPIQQPVFEMASDSYRPARSFPVDISEDFVDASRSSTQSVVYIKNISERMAARSYYDWFFDRSPSKETRISSGSGVIFTSDGYIVTNNHVVADADQIEVVYNKNTYPAQLIGVDPSTDLAVLKIDGRELPAIKIGNSRDLQVGEWVIAVGNPFNLTSTVTAGIVSAKGREINILQSSFPIESFIQTDAAINPGNSGGALVNKLGELVGINTAILSRTGSYAGYGFAVPIDIVDKVVRDIIQYGEVQKAFFGGDVADYDSDIAARLDIQQGPDASYEGVILSYIQSEGAAEQAGMAEGDIILQIDEHLINSRAEFEEELSYHSPGDMIHVIYTRNNQRMETDLTLTNREGTTSFLKREIYSSRELGASLESVPKVERDLLDIEYGVKVYNIQRGLLRSVGITEDVIITDVNNYPVTEPEELVEILTKVRGRVELRGVSKQGKKGKYTFYLR